MESDIEVFWGSLLRQGLLEPEFRAANSLLGTL